MTGGGQVQAATPEAVASALRAAGYPVTVSRAGLDEDPSLRVRAGGHDLNVFFSGCRAGSCARVTVSFGWNPQAGDTPDLEFVNEWNSNSFTQAYVYEGRYFLDSTLILRGGYTRAALNVWMTDYLSDLKSFETQLF